MTNLTSADVTEELAGPFEAFYEGRPAELTNLFDILVWDDRRAFASVA